MKKNEVELCQDVKDVAELELVWQNSIEIANRQKQERKEINRTFNVLVKQNTPIEQVCKSAILYEVVREALSLSPNRKIFGRLGKSEPVLIEADNLAKGILDLYQSAKSCKDLGIICELTKTGIKADKYAFNFALPKQ